MPYKDYYAILKIPSSATDLEIKKAYRKLALQFHPDKHKDTVSVTEKFLDIQEAYFILKDKTKRAAYHHQRNTLSQNKHFKTLAENVEEVLQESVQLNKEMAMLNPFRLDVDYVCFQIGNTLSSHHLYLMEATSDQKIRESFIENIMATLHLLPFNVAKSFIVTIKELAIHDVKTSEKINRFAFQLQWKYYWHKNKIYFALSMAVLLCVIIYSSK